MLRAAGSAALSLLRGAGDCSSVAALRPFALLGALPCAGLVRLTAKHPEIIDIRGRGLMVGVELGGANGQGSPAKGVASVSARAW